MTIDHKPAPTRHPRPMKAAVYFDERENALVVDAARREDLTLSQYIRRAAVRDATKRMAKTT